MRILLIQLRRLGDILLTTGAISAVKTSFPEATVDFLCEPIGKPILETNPQLSDVLVYQRNRGISEIRRVRKRDYRIVIDFMNNPRSAYLTGLSGAQWRVGFKKFGRSLFYNINAPVPLEPEYVGLRKIRLVNELLNTLGKPPCSLNSGRPRIWLNAEDQAFAEQWLKSENLNGRSFVVMAPIHRHPIRQWRLDGFRELGVRIHRDLGVPVYAAWGPGEEGQIHRLCGDSGDLIKPLPPTRYREMGAIFQKARLVVTNDSGAMHLAVAVGTPTVTVYGPTRPIDWNPPAEPNSQNIAVVAESVACLGCHRGRCPVGHLCMTQLGESDVFRACRLILREEQQ